MELPLAAPGRLLPLTVSRLVALILLSSFGSVANANGLVVTAVSSGSEAEFASLQIDDVVTAARVRGRDKWQPLTTPFDLDALQTSCGRGCVVELRGQRRGIVTTWYLRAGDWLLKTAPLSDGNDATAATLVAVNSPPARSGWRLAEAIASAAATDDWPIVERRLAELQALPAPTARLTAVTASIDSLAGANQEAIEPFIVAALADLERSDIAAAVRWRAEFTLAKSLVRRGQLERARERLAQLDAAMATASPSSPFVADVATLRGTIDRSSGDLDAAQQHFQSALAVLDALPGRTALSRFNALRGLGIVTTIKGEFDAAEQVSIEALRLIRKLDDQRSEARLLNNIGILYVRRGDMTRAEYYYQQAMTLNRQFGAWLSYSYNLANLGDLAIARQDPEKAASLFATARTTILEQAPDSSDAAQITTMLANAQFELGQWQEARDNYRWSLATYEAAAPGSLDTAGVRIGLGDIALAEGDAATALEYFDAALTTRQQGIPGSLEHAEALMYVSEALTVLGDVDRATREVEAAANILRRLAPDSMEYAATQFALAEFTERDGQRETALDYFEKALAAAERQTERLGGADDSRIRFAGKFAELTDSYVRLLLAEQRAAEAFGAVERYRARLLLTMLAERESTMSYALPPDLANDRRRLERRYTEARGELEYLLASGADSDELAAAERTVTETEVARNALTQRLRAVAEGFAQLRYPQPLSLTAAQQALDPGTLALTYYVGENGVTLFVVARDRFDVVEIDTTVAALDAAVSRFRTLIELGRRGGLATTDLATVGRQLFDWLIDPAGDLSRYERLLIAADGPLRRLPYAALVLPTTSSETRPRYLIEVLPVHKTLSLTLYDELRRRRPRTIDPQYAVAAFAAPTTAIPTIDSNDFVSVALQTVSQLEPLPYSREEVRDIAAVYGGSAAFTADGGTSETVFIAAASDADIVHVAAHAIVDEQNPLDSALVLSVDPDGGAATDGLLHVWEVFDRLRLKASLVVLSACRSGIGRESSGEGLAGLQRAFLYAGARSVIASLWNVSDRSTRELMVAFHRELSRGADRASALQAAQLALLNAGSAHGLQHPYHWAAFELTGDHDTAGPTP
ncbi:MAG: CHAT domain-containing protein [Pseudomonadota bacterium]